MDKVLYFKPKSGFLNLKYLNFIEEFLGKFNLKIIKNNGYVYFAENEDMLVKCDTDFIEVLMYTENRTLKKELYSYFFNYKE